MPPLHRAFALAQRNHAAARVGQYLDFDVPRALQIFFEIQALIAKGIHGLGSRVAKRGFEFAVARNQPHALAATARHGLQQNGITHALGQGSRGRFLGRIVGAGDGGHFDAARKLACFGL